jgi:hypothetical protein
MAVHLDFDKLFLMVNTGLYTARGLLNPYKVVFKSVSIMVVLLLIVVNNVILLFSCVERTILRASSLARVPDKLPKIFARQCYACLPVPHWIPMWLRGSNMIVKRGGPFAQTTMILKIVGVRKRGNE